MGQVTKPTVLKHWRKAEINKILCEIHRIFIQKAVVPSHFPTEDIVFHIASLLARWQDYRDGVVFENLCMVGVRIRNSPLDFCTWILIHTVLLFHSTLWNISNIVITFLPCHQFITSASWGEKFWRTPLNHLACPKKYKMLSYRGETALQGTLVLAESGRLELRDNILLIL